MQTKPICLKFWEEALIFIKGSTNKDVSKVIIERTDGLLSKFTLAILSLEFLWKIAENGVDNKEQPEKFEWVNRELIRTILDEFGGIDFQLAEFLQILNKLVRYSYPRDYQ